MSKEIAVKDEVPQVGAVYSDERAFELAQRQATALSKSELVPDAFKNKLPNCLIALELAKRIGASPLMVMQNLYIVHGKPSWSSQFVISAINSSGKFSPLRFEIKGEGDDKTCIAWAKDLADGERLESPPVSIGMAKKEGWYSKNGSKWQSLPDLMLRYRAATFFGRLYAPEILMGMGTQEEAYDVGGMRDVTPQKERTILDNINDEIAEELGEVMEPIEEIIAIEPPMTQDGKVRWDVWGQAMKDFAARCNPEEFASFQEVNKEHLSAYKLASPKSHEKFIKEFSALGQEIYQKFSGNVLEA